MGCIVVKRRKIPLLLYYLFLILYLELIYRGFVLKNIFSLNTLLVILFSLSFVFLLSFISSLGNSKVNRVISIFISFFIILIFISQYVYYKFYNSIYSVFSVLKGTNQVFGGFFSSIMIMVKNNIFVIFLMLLPLLLFIIFGKRIFKFHKTKLYQLMCITLFFELILIKFIVVQLSNNGMYSLKRLYFEIHAPMIMINKVGLLSMEVMDVERFIFGFEEKFTLNNEVINKPIDEIEEKIEYNVLDINFESLINNETDQNVIKMHEYFRNTLPTNKNEYTGIFEGKNLIYITAEGFDTIAIDEVLTPTLYKLVNHGFVFNNYYQPLYSVSTSDGEYMFLNSLIPKEGVWSFYRSSNIFMPYGIGRVFNNLEYDVVNAYHDHSYAYYDRNLSHPNLGFTNYIGCGNGLEKLMNCRIWPESDVEMIDATINDYINSDKFMIYYMTVSGHLNYTFTGNSMAYKNRDLVKDLPYSDHVKAYLAANIEFDRAMEKLLGYLEEAGKLDDTVIVISPDHYPYGLTKDELNEKSSTDRSNKFENFHTSLVIYNSKMEENVVVDKYVSSIDVLPTVYNLFGISYDSRLLMGRDALSDNDGLVILSDRSWINENGSYNSITGEFIKFNDNIDDEYLNKVNNDVYQRFTMSSLLLNENNGVYLDYYRRLGIW